MARIEGIDLPRNKRVEVGLTYCMVLAHSFASDPGEHQNQP
jgi:ribosomal protein S13